MRYWNAQQMIFDAYQTGCGSVKGEAAEIARLGTRIQASQEGNNDWKIVHGLEAGAVISQVEALPSHLAALARICFGPFTREELAKDQETAEIGLYRQLLTDGIRLPGQGKGKPTAQQLLTLRCLCAAALYHHSETTWPYLRTGLQTPRAIKSWLEEEKGHTIDVRRWTSSSHGIQWRHPWERLCSTLNLWECKALDPVANLCDFKAA